VFLFDSYVKRKASQVFWCSCPSFDNSFQIGKKIILTGSFSYKKYTTHWPECCVNQGRIKRRRSKYLKKTIKRKHNPVTVFKAAYDGVLDPKLTHFTVTGWLHLCWDTGN
jgi:hypothetical protein